MGDSDLLSQTFLSAKEEGIPSKEIKTSTFYLMGTLVIIPYILIFILFGLLANVKEESTYNTYSSSIPLVTFPSSSTSSYPILVGSALSLESNGAVRSGGGTTIFKNVIPDSEYICPKYLGLDAISSSTFIRYYVDYGESTSTIDIVQMGTTPNIGTIMLSETAPDVIYDMVVLAKGEVSSKFLYVTQVRLAS